MSTHPVSAPRPLSVLNVPVDQARQVGEAALVAAGVPAEAAGIQIDLLVEAELRGHSSHGLLRLPRIIDRIGNGVTDPVLSGEHSWPAEALLRVDGQQGLGPVVALRALEAISARARRTGVACATISAANHLGMLSWYVEKVARGGQVALGFTTSEALVHPWGGRQALVGSNPLAIGVPARPDPLVFDMATSTVSMGKIIDHANRDIPLEPGWAVDAEGEPTTDARAARAGAISPFGGAKGYGLGIALEALVGTLTGTSFGRDVVGTLDDVHKSTKGDVFVVVHPPDAGENQALSDYLAAVRTARARRADRPVLVPGDRARSRREAGIERGIEVPGEIWSAITRLAEGTN
jgi:L-2-hydroxycarboxylate dehydrogenase (NAD+)